MKFDKSKVFTPFNCEKVKIGSSGYYSDRKETLISRVQSDDKDHYGVLKNICDNANDDYVFLVDNCARYQYFYLVEEPKEKTKRPCTREELIEMLEKQRLPLLKMHDGSLHNVISISNYRGLINFVAIANNDYNYDELCKQFTLLDGTELWVEE